MARGRGRTKVITKTQDQDDIGEMFNQLLGDEKSLDIEIIKDKYLKLKYNVEKVYKLLLSFKKSMLLKSLKNSHNVDTYVKDLDNFVDDCKSIIPDDLDDSKLLKHYLSIKDNKVINDCITICKNLIRYKKYIEDNENLDDSFIKNNKNRELIIFPFSNFDIKFIYQFAKIDNSVKKYTLIFLNLLYNATYDIYNIVTSPDIDISKFSNVIVSSISNAKKMIPRANKAFKKIEESVDLLQNNFNGYYKDFITSRNPGIIIENFILDCGKTAGDNVDMDLARQFKSIAMFYKKKNSGKIKDPRVSQIFELLDKNFSKLDLNNDDDDDEYCSDDNVDITDEIEINE